MNNLFKRLSEHLIGRPRGYSQEELFQIERLYDIKVEGYFKDFLLEAGRTSGCDLGNGALRVEFLFFPYTSTNVRQQILEQHRLRESFLDIAFTEMKTKGILDIKKTAIYPFVESKPFFLSCENQNQYYFISTAHTNTRVHRYEENDKQMFIAEYSLEAYLELALVPSRTSIRQWTGELLVP